MTLRVSFWSDLPTNSMWTAEDIMTSLEQFRWHRSSTGYIRIGYQATLGCHHHTSDLKKRTVLLLPFLHRKQTPHYRTLQWRYLDEAFSSSRLYSMTLSQSGVPYPISIVSWLRCTWRGFHPTLESAALLRGTLLLLSCAELVYML